MGADGESDDPRWQMLEIFQECQLNALSHTRLLANLKNIFDKSRFSHFCDEFFELCRYSLVNSERTPYRERTVDFIAKFALYCGKSSEDGLVDTVNNRLLLKLFVFCMKYSECPNHPVRFRCMQIMHKLLEGIGDNGVIPDDLYRSLRDVLLRRVQDVKAMVRVQAVQALARIQDPTQADCPAVEAFIWLARHDVTAEVRRAALAAMVLTTKTLPSLIERCRDLSNNVRRTAYKILAARSVLRSLSIANRIRILHDGLSDRSEDVKQAAQELVISWFKASDSDPINLLRRLDTEGVPETSQLLLDNLFTVLPRPEFETMVLTWIDKHLTDERILKQESYTSDVAFFWRALAEYLRGHQSKHSMCEQSDAAAEDASQNPDEPVELGLFERIVPSVSAYVDMAKTLVDRLVQLVLDQEFDVKTMEQECIVASVLRLAHSIDLSDEFGRRKLVVLVRDWVTSPTVPSTLCPQLLKVHALLEPNLRKRINNVIEMISELCDPVEPPSEPGLPTPAPEPTDPVLECRVNKDEERTIRLRIAKLDVHLNELNESLHNCVLRKQFEQATGLRDKCAELEAERSALLQQLHGTGVGVRVPAKTDDNAVPSADVDSTLKMEPAHDDGDEEQEDVKNAEDANQGLLQRCSPAVLLKANRIAALVVQQSPTLWRLPASLRSLLDSLILPSIQCEDPSVRNQAMLTLGLCCTMDLPLAIQYLTLFYSAMRVDHVLISETALKCIVDCLLIFGFRPFHDAKVHPNKPFTMGNGAAAAVMEDGDSVDDDDDDLSDSDDFMVSMRRPPDQDQGNSSLGRRDELSKTAARLLKPIVALLDSEEDELRTTSALGLAKLLIYDRFVSSQVLSKLILLWFNPNSEDRPGIRRGLACFFTDYACGLSASSPGAGTGNAEHQAALMDAVLPTLTALLRAPALSPLSEIEASDVAALLVHLTDSVLLQSKNDKSAGAGDVEGDDDDDKENRAIEENQENAANTTEPVHHNIHHDRLALLLKSEILRAPQSAEAKLYLRMLCQLRPSLNNLHVHKELLYLSDAMLKYADRSCTLTLHRFRKQVNQCLERLGLDPDTVLAEIKRQSNEVAADHSDEADAGSPTQETTLIASCVRPTIHPTLLGSARVNMHLIGSGEDPSFQSRQLNRTILGHSVVDRSTRGNLLNFSESDESDTTQDEQLLDASQTLPSAPKARAVQSSSALKDGNSRASKLFESPGPSTRAVLASKSIANTKPTVRGKANNTRRAVTRRA